MKRTLSVALTCTMAWLCAARGAEPAEQEYTLEIARQPLADTLMEFSKQTSLNISFLRKGDDQPDVMVGPLRGRYTVESALRELLAKSGLTFVRVNEFTIAVTAVDDSGRRRIEHPVRTKTMLNDAVTRYVLIADAQSAGSEGRDAGDQGPLAARQSQPVPSTEADSRISGRSMEEIVTTGSRLKRRGGEEPAPVIVFDRKKIAEIGASTVPEVLRYSTQQPFTFAETNTPNGAQFAQFRGLPVGSTAVLINGRRTALTDLNSNGINLNTIPLAAIDRIEVLASSASAMYGADAVGGVVNLIMKKDITRPVLDLRYGGAAGGGEERRASLTTGYSNERFRGSVLADYYDRDPLFGAERDRWSNQDYRRFGGTDRRVTNGNPGTVVSPTSANLPGLPSRFAFVRPGSSGVGLTTADFISVPTEQDLQAESRRRFEPIVMEHTRRSAAAFAEFDVTSAATLFAEGFDSNTTLVDYLLPAVATLNVPANNPFNPFGSNVNVRYLYEGTGPRRTKTETELYGATLGLRGSLSSWDWEVSGTRARYTSYSSQNQNTSINTTQANCLLTNSATRAPGACGGITEALNVFQDGPGGSPTLLASLVSPPSTFDADVTSDQATAFVRGPAVALPAGSVDVVIGGSGGKEEILSRALTPTFNAIPGERSTSAAFAELHVPVVSAAMQVPVMRELSFNVAARYDSYSDFGGTFNPQYGLVWMPVSGLSLTASYGTSFNPPSLFMLFSPTRDIPNIAVTDPRRNENTTVTVSTGGNPDLQPEEGRSFITGFVLTPTRWPELRLSAHYWNVILEDRVSAYSFVSTLENESTFADRIIRDAPLPTDPAGRPGPLRRIDISPLNFAHLETSGLDMAVSYSTETRWGRFSPSLSATWTRSYESKDLPNLPSEERVGLAHSSGSIPRWKAVATLAWAKSGMGVSATARYLQGYSDSARIAGRGVSTGRHVSSQTLVDLQMSVDAGDLVAAKSPFINNLRISAGASNVLDEEPPFVDSVNVDGYDPAQGDLIGRTLYINLTKGF